MSKEKLTYEQWVKKHFYKDDDHNYWTSKEDDGFAPQDKSRYREDDLKKDYQKYEKKFNKKNE